MKKPRHRMLEEKIILDLKAKVHKNSGAMAEKHDGSDKNHLYEIKTTRQRSFSIVQVYWASLCKFALRRIKEPILIVAFDDGDSPMQDLRKIVILDYEYFKGLMEIE